MANLRLHFIWKFKLCLNYKGKRIINEIIENELLCFIQSNLGLANIINHNAPYSDVLQYGYGFFHRC